MAKSGNQFNLRDMEVSSGMAKCVEDTAMLDGTAKEANATGTNETVEHIVKAPSPGPLGAEGKY